MKGRQVGRAAFHAAVKSYLNPSWHFGFMFLALRLSPHDSD
jgi:hypothetical protein